MFLTYKYFPKKAFQHKQVNELKGICLDLSQATLVGKAKNTGSVKTYWQQRHNKNHRGNSTETNGGFNGTNDGGTVMIKSMFFFLPECL